MINQAKNTFALIGVVTLIVIACSSALSDDDDVIIPNNSTEVNNSNTSGTTTTNTGTTNTSSSGTTTTNTVAQNEIGRYQIAGAGADNTRVWIIDTATGAIMLREWYTINIWNDANDMKNKWQALPN